MKKVLFFAATLLLGFTITSCEKEEIGGTAVESMAGQWYVDIDAVNDDGTPIKGGAHYFGYDEERITLLTYNNASNSSTQMWIDDLGAFDLIPHVHQIANVAPDRFPISGHVILVLEDVHDIMVSFRHMKSGRIKK